LIRIGGAGYAWGVKAARRRELVMGRWIGAACALMAGLMAAGAALAKPVEDAPAQNAPVQNAPVQARAALEAGMTPHAARGYRADRGQADLITPLRLDAGFLWPVRLRRGVAYRVYGACDADCSDLDMEIYDADGLLVERNDAVDATPFVQIRPARAGTYYVRLWLADCVAEPCFVGARVVSGGR
jgi:hypothetical protein